MTRRIQGKVYINSVAMLALLTAPPLLALLGCGSVPELTQKQLDAVWEHAANDGRVKGDVNDLARDYIAYGPDSQKTQAIMNALNADVYTIAVQQNLTSEQAHAAANKICERFRHNMNKDGSASNESAAPAQSATLQPETNEDQKEANTLAKQMEHDQRVRQLAEEKVYSDRLRSIQQSDDESERERIAAMTPEERAADKSRSERRELLAKAKAESDAIISDNQRRMEQENEYAQRAVAACRHGTANPECGSTVFWNAAKARWDVMHGYTAERRRKDDAVIERAAAMEREQDAN